MAINNDDVKLFESQRLTDEEDGGGRVTGSEVIDGNVNNLFQDISRIDRTIGDVALRKAYIGVTTENNDAYLGSHIILTDPPADDNVSVLLFNTGSQTDERRQARDRVEAYVVPGSATTFELLGTQLQGQRSIVCVQREQERVPAIGDVYRLYDPDTDYEQYLRVVNVEHRIATFTTVDPSGKYIEFERRRIDMEISAPLETLFPGGEPTPVGTRETTKVAGEDRNKSLVFGTEVADAARYYGIQSTQSDINPGDLTVKVASVYSPLVPSARVESPLLDQYGGLTAKTMVACSDNDRSVNIQLVHINGNQSRGFLQTGALPGSVTLVVEGGTFTDDSAGTLNHSSGSNSFSKLTIDYETGEVNVWRTSSYTTTVASASYRPAIAITGASLSGAVEIGLQNRGFNYTLNLAEAKPRPGTLVVSYIALGKWQDLRDPGNGLLVGSGSGTIDYGSGSVALTLDAMPDPDSALVFGYIAQDDSEVTLRTGSAVPDAIRFWHFTSQPGIKPGSLTLTYLSGGETKTLSDQGNGLLTGDGEGSIHYASGELSFRLDALPDASTEIELQYEQGEVAGGVVDVSIDGGGLMSGTIAGAPLLPGSVNIQFAVERDSNVPNSGYQRSGLETYQTTHQHTKQYSDDGSGSWRGIAGTIDYQTGAFTLQAVENYDYKEYISKWDQGEWRYQLQTTTTTRTEVFSGNTVLAKAQENSLSHSPFTESLPNPELTIDLLPLISDPLLPGSLVFSWNGETYFDRDGLLYKNISTSTNAGIQVGAIDYSGGLATLSIYPPGEPSGSLPSATIEGAATISAGLQVETVAFRTAGAPIRPGSMQLTAVRVDNGEIITATCDFNGEFNTSEVQGRVDIGTGWCEIRFTDEVNEIYVLPQSIRYNAIVQTSLPLDAELIGLDPVRLPPDGRVPIYRPGDIVVISHTGETSVATPSAGETITLTRDHQAEITIKDSNGKLLDSAQYITDREAGTVTFADPLSLVDPEGDGLLTPLVIKDRVEHMSVVSDVQINGELSIIAPVPWNLPAGETTVSSAVVYGDLQARVHHFFTQKVWDGGDPNWGDERIGDNTTAQYNTINYPVEVTNKGAIYGQWALIFTSSTSFQVVEEKLGIIATGNTAADTTPNNPETGVPYFIIKSEGWGTGWAAGNVVRFNTDGLLAPVWICRTVLAGQGTETNDKFTLQIRGDAD